MTRLQKNKPAANDSEWNYDVSRILHCKKKDLVLYHWNQKHSGSFLGTWVQEVRSRPVGGLWSCSAMLTTLTEKNLNPTESLRWTFLWPYNHILPHFLQRGIITQTLSFTKSFGVTRKPPDRPLCLPPLPRTLGAIRNNPARLSRDFALWKAPARLADFLTSVLDANPGLARCISGCLASTLIKNLLAAPRRRADANFPPSVSAPHGLKKNPRDYTYSLR